MRQIFHAELEQLGQNLIDMATLVETAITDAGAALLERDLDKAQSVIAADIAIDQLEHTLDEQCVLLLAQQQPVATDLRVVVSALRISANLERMGDLARHIAEISRTRYPNSALPEHLRNTFVKMDSAAKEICGKMRKVLESRDVDLVHKVDQTDDLLDSLHQDTFVKMLTPDWEGTAQEIIDVTLLSRYYERFGDHAVSISRRVMFLVTGDFIEGANA